MLTRTKRHKVKFAHAFNLEGVDRTLSSGEYEVVSDEELLEGLSFPIYRRVSTFIMLPGLGFSSIEMISVSPDDLAAALVRDRPTDAEDTAKNGNR